MGIIRRTLLIAASLLAIVLLLAGSPAGAHATVESSDPADGAVVDDPVTEIVLVFTDQTEPVGDGFQVFQSDGDVRAPNAWESPDGRRFVLHFDPPITGGETGVQWTIRSADSHALSGGFAFTVIAVASGASSPVDVTESGASSLVDDAATPTAGSGGSAAEEPRSRAEEETEAETEPAVLGDPVEQSTIESVAVALPGAIAEIELDEPGTVRGLALAGRLTTMLGSLVAIGAIVFLIVVLRGTRLEGRLITRITGAAALAVAAGAVGQSAAFVASIGGGWTALLSPVVWVDALSSRFGSAIGLQLIGAFGVSTGSCFRCVPIGKAGPEMIGAERPRVGVLAAGSRPSAIEDQPSLSAADRATAGRTPPQYRWHPTSASSGAVLGVVALLSAFVVDGHTLGGSSPLLSGIVTLTHTVGGSVWVGGVIVLFSILHHRIRADRRVEAVDLAVRYSVLATASLVAVALAGLGLTYSHIDAISDVWTTSWGRLVLAKLGLVGVAALLGAANHFIVLPRLVTRSNDTGLGTALKRLVAIEIIVLVMVVALSAQLVATGL